MAFSFRYPQFLAGVSTLGLAVLLSAASSSSGRRPSGAPPPRLPAAPAEAPPVAFPAPPAQSPPQARPVLPANATPPVAPAPRPEPSPPAPAPAPTIQAGADPYASARQLCVDETNRYRATLNLPPLRRNADLERCADAAARSDHASKQPHGHFVATSGCGIAFAENEIPWWNLSFAGTVEGTVQKGLAQMWAEGPGGGHYENMRGDYTEVGCGFFESSGQITVVQDLR